LCSPKTRNPERIAQALIEREVLDSGDIALLLEGKSLLPLPAPVKDDAMQQVISQITDALLQGRERPATAKVSS